MSAQDKVKKPISKVYQIGETQKLTPTWISKITEKVADDRANEKAVTDQKKRLRELKPCRTVPLRPLPAAEPDPGLLNSVGKRLWWKSKGKWVVVVSARKAYSAIDVFVKAEKEKSTHLVADWDLSIDRPADKGHSKPNVFVYNVKLTGGV